jgi:hypothetical protein
MFTSAECRAMAARKLAEADQDGRHRRRLTTAAEGWLFLASQLRRVELVTSVEVVTRKRTKRREKAKTATRAAPVGGR